MGLSGDDRARVPFALVGVVLLVGSATFAASVHTGPDRRADPGTERALERARGEAVGALRAATRAAAGRAMRTPVAVAANTTAGRALDDPFRDALALRIRAQLEQRLDNVSVAAGSAVATTRLERAESIRSRVASVRLEPAGDDGSALRVETEVVLTARRRGGVVDRVRRRLSLVVGTPVLAVHERVVRFERALAAGPTEYGLARQLTAQLYAVAWVRGYAQYGGGPVANVLATRHVEQATNRGLLSVQRATVGCPARDSVTALRAAMARTAATDLGIAAGVPEDVARFGARSFESRTRTEPEDAMSVAVGRTADEALLGVRRNLTRILRRAYSAKVRLGASVETVSTTGDAGAPGPGWTEGDRHVEVSVSGASSGPAVRPDDGWHRLRSYHRRVRRVEVREWHRGGERRTTRRRTVARVTLAVLGRHAVSRYAPRRGIDFVHEPGGPLGGPNLAGIEDRAVARLVAGQGGVDELAGRAVADSLPTESVVLRGRRPEGLRKWVTGGVLDVHRRVANRSVAVSRGDVGTYRVNPPDVLGDAIASDRRSLLQVPGTYPSVAAKARVAARAAYLHRVRAGLDRRADRRRATRSEVNRSLADAGMPLTRVAAAMDTRRRASTGTCREVVDRIAGNRTVVVGTTPTYLTTGAVERESVGLLGEGRFHPLATRNLNLVTIPRQEAASGIVGALVGEDTVALRTAASALRATETLASPSPNRTLRRRHRRLRRAVARSLAVARTRLRIELRRAGVGAGPAQRRAMVRAAFGRWNSPGERAIALVVGNASDAVVAEAAARDGSLDPTDRELLAARLRAAVGDLLRSDAVRTDRDLVTDATRTSRRVARVALEAGVEEGLDRTAGRRLRRRVGAIPAGMPVAPVPGYWYATVNYWTVETRGRYERFVVRVRQGGPDGPLRYVRDGRTAAFDADGDGAPERVGRAARVDFAVETAVVVVVPAGPRGIGDVDGDRDELSPGWER